MKSIKKEVVTKPEKPRHNSTPASIMNEVLHAIWTVSSLLVFNAR